MERPYAIEILMNLAEGESPSPSWWSERCAWALVRAGILPPECDGLLEAELLWETDPESQEEYVRVSLPLPPSTPLGRARELAHMLSSVLAGEGYTLRQGEELIERLPGELPENPRAGSFAGESFREGRVHAEGCMRCVLAGDGGVGCCSEGGAFSLADIGAALLDGEEALVAQILSLPGRVDDAKWEPHLVAGRCAYHDRSKGCCLGPARMPLQCRTYLCLPERLLPAELLAEYEAYVERLEEAEAFISEHMRREGGVDFHSPLVRLRQAAERAFAAWEAAR